MTAPCSVKIIRKEAPAWVLLFCYSGILQTSTHAAGGAAYFSSSGIVSPMALMWDNENYYLLAWDAEAQLRKHYRVDKMTDISALDAPREGMEDFSEQDLSAYTKKVFSMFSGEERTVRLRFANHLIGSVLDRFGKDVIVVADGPEHFKVTLNVVTSPKFYAWLFGFGTEVEILSPPSARQEMQRMLTAAAQLYAADAQS